MGYNSYLSQEVEYLILEINALLILKEGIRGFSLKRVDGTSLSFYEGILIFSNKNYNASIILH